MRAYEQKVSICIFLTGKNAQIKVEQRMDHAPKVTEFVVHVSFSLVNSGICSED